MSLEGLKANDGIIEKHNYVLRHSILFLGDRGAISDLLFLEKSYYHRAHSRLHPKPLDIEQDAIECKKKRNEIARELTEIDEEVMRIDEEKAILLNTLNELQQAMEAENKHYIEWNLQASMGWYLARFGQTNKRQRLQAFSLDCRKAPCSGHSTT